MNVGEKRGLFVVLWMLVCTAAAFVYGAYLHSRALRVDIVKLSDLSEVTSSETSVAVEVERIERRKNVLHLYGWAIKPGELFNAARSQFLLKAPDGRIIKPRSFTFERLDVGQLYTPNHEDYLYNFDHDFAGVSAVADLRDLDGGGPFKVLLLFDNGRTRELIDTGKSFTKSELPDVSLRPVLRGTVR